MYTPGLMKVDKEINLRIDILYKNNSYLFQYQQE